ncbi:YcjX family protein [Planctomycetota bacterium]|nr:YcjX family protein [Planctomycetota bacterium]
MKKIMVLGGRAAGKTMFIAGLAEYCRASRGGRLKLVPRDDDSRAYMSRVQEFLRVGEWPPATSDVHFVSLRLLTEDQRELVLEVVDYPGEVVELLHGGQDLGPWRKVLDSLPAVDKVLLLLSLDQDLPDDDDPDRSGQLERQDAAADLLERLLEMQQAAGGAGRELDVIPVVTKSDLLAGLTGPEADENARDRTGRRAHRLLKNLDASPGMRVRETQFVTAVGHVIQGAEGSPPMPPAGAMEPSGFADLVEEMHKADEERQSGADLRKLLMGLGVAAAVLFAWWGLGVYKKQSIEEAAATGSTEEVLALANEKLPATSDVGAKVRQRISRVLDGLQSRLASAPSRDALDEGSKTLDDLLGNPNNPELGRTQSLKERYVARIEGRMVDELEGAPTYQGFLQALSAYREQFGTNGPRASEVGALLDRRRAAEQGRIRRAATQLDASSLASIRQRLERSLEFLRLFPEDPRAEELQRANRVAEALLTATSIQVAVQRIDLVDADEGDRVMVQFHKDASRSSGSLLGSSETKKGPETTWVEADEASYALDLKGGRTKIFVAVKDPGTGVLNLEDDWGVLPVSPLRDFVLDGGKFKLTKEGSLFFTKALESGTIRFLDETVRLITFGNPGYDAVTGSSQGGLEAVAEEVAASEEVTEVTGYLKLQFNVGSRGSSTSFTEEERLAYLRFYLSAEGWRPDE